LPAQRAFARPSALRLETRLVAPDKRADVVGHVERLGPPLVVERELRQLGHAILSAAIVLREDRFPVAFLKEAA